MCHRFVCFLISSGSFSDTKIFYDMKRRRLELLCFVDRASLYNLVNKANLVHSFIECLFLSCTCFGRLCAHHQEKQLCLCDTWYLLFCMDDCLLCIPPCIPESSTQNNKYQVSHKYRYFSR